MVYLLKIPLNRTYVTERKCSLIEKLIKHMGNCKIYQTDIFGFTL